VPPPPSLWVQASARIVAFIAPECGLSLALRVSARISARQKGPVCAPVSASGIPVPRPGGDWFDDCVLGPQFEPYYPHHPVLRNRKSRRRLPIGRFCGDFRRYRSTLSVSSDTCGLSGRFLASSLCIQKFRSPRQGFDGQCRSAAGNFWESWGAKSASLRARSVIIADSIQGLQTAGSILAEHREVARLQCRVANDLRRRPARELVQGTRVRSSC
jgi:hypothetical protein